jgi:hypothetical protein
MEAAYHRGLLAGEDRLVPQHPEGDPVLLEQAFHTLENGSGGATTSLHELGAIPSAILAGAKADHLASARQPCYSDRESRAHA